MWFGKEIYPEILKRQNITFYIVGSNAPDEVKNLNTTGIKYKGFVSEHELCDLYQKVRIVVVPLRYGAGIKGKVVDAMYQEVPIISTSVGIEGILEAESCVEIADSKEEFIDKLTFLYNDFEKLSFMSLGCKHIIQKYFSKENAWEKIKDDFK